MGYSVFCEDALKFNWEKLPKKFTLFGNLPYEIVGTLIIKSVFIKNKFKI